MRYATHCLSHPWPPPPHSLCRDHVACMQKVVAAVRNGTHQQLYDDLVRTATRTCLVCKVSQPASNFIEAKDSLEESQSCCCCHCRTRGHPNKHAAPVSEDQRTANKKQKLPEGSSQPQKVPHTLSIQLVRVLVQSSRGL